MTSQQLDPRAQEPDLRTQHLEELTSRTQHLEEKITSLETELSQLKQLLASLLQKEKPWWLEIAGSFKDDPTFEEATRLGREWRQSAE